MVLKASRSINYFRFDLRYEISLILFYNFTKVEQYEAVEELNFTQVNRFIRILRR